MKQAKKAFLIGEVVKEESSRFSKPTVLKVDKSLDKYLDKGLFKEKIDKANHILKTVGLPKF